MRLSELKGNLPLIKRYRTDDNGIGVFKCDLRELHEGEVYDMILRYRCHIREGLYVETSYAFSGDNIDELLSEKRNALEIFEELRISEDGLSDEEFNEIIELKKQYCEDNYIVCTDETLPSESKLLMSKNYMGDNFKVKQMYDTFVKEIKFNELDKLESYTISLNFGLPIIMTETLNNDFDKNGNLIRSELNTFNTNTEITECKYDEFNRLMLKKYIFNDELVYVDKYKYIGNLRYCDMTMPDGKLESHEVRLLEDGLPIIETTHSISKYGSTEGITTYDYIDNGDVIIDSISIVPSEVVEL